MNHLLIFKLFLLYKFITKSKIIISNFCKMADEIGRAAGGGRVLWWGLDEVGDG